MRAGATLSCLAVAAILTGCGSSTTTTPVTAPAGVATTSTTSTTAAATTPIENSSAFSGPDGVPAFKPSTVVNEGPGSLRIVSPESVTRVGTYYASTLASEGAVIVSKTLTTGGASFTIHENGQEATVAVYPTASGSGVLISSSGPSSLDGVPVYQPSVVLSHGPASLRIISEESVAKVGAYYVLTLAGEGWVIVSRTLTPYGASFRIKKNGQEATIAVSRYGAGSTVLISGRTLP